MLASVLDPKDYAISSRNDGIDNSGQRKKIDIHSLKNPDLKLTQEQVQANKRLRSPSKQSPFANKRHSPRNHPPILHKLDTNKVLSSQATRLIEQQNNNVSKYHFDISEKLH